MINTNVLGLVHLTHEILPFMTAKNSGYVINIGSTAGNHPYFGANVYGATKAFVRQFSCKPPTIPSTGLLDEAR